MPEKAPFPGSLAAGEAYRDFHILRVVPIPELRVTAYDIRDERTGAAILHLHGEDRENLFAIGFRTPPADSTGLPHILEHSVLAGSERYPVKDAFNELHRGTLQTFINAFTYPDKTIYPVASQVKTDYFNLARVYADLVFRPRLLEETFRQEGHHLERVRPGDPESPLSCSGIVFNEMKGAYSSPDNLTAKVIQENLYPDTIYRFDSGGAPEVIPSLTYEQFKAFHRSFYAPANARVFLYGNIDTREHLDFLREILPAGMTAAESAIAAQPRWDAPRSVRASFPADPGDDAAKSVVNVAWMTAENTEEETVLLLEIMAGLLVGSAAGPLRKALLDSRLGQDISPSTGFERDYRQSCFTAGLRGARAEDAETIEKLILSALAKAAQDGFDRDLVEGVLHQVEFAGKEIQRGSYPYGIALMSRAFHAWLYGGDPVGALNFPRQIDAVRDRWARQPDLFQRIVTEQLLENPHRLLVVMAPDSEQNAREEAKLSAILARRRVELTEVDLDRIDREAAALRRYQGEADSPEALASLPKLHVKDLERQGETIPTTSGSVEDVPALFHEIHANGVAYLDLAFDVSAVPERLQPYLPLLGKAVTGMGAAGLRYDEMAKRLALKTGGLSCALGAGAVRGGGAWQRMIFRVKALHRNIPDAVALLGDCLAEGDLSDFSRLEDLLAEKKNHLHAAVVPSGHAFARMSAAASLSLPAWRDEQWHGRRQLQTVTRMAESFSAENASLASVLMELKTVIFNRGNVLVNITGDEEGMTRLRDAAEVLLRRLSPGRPAAAPEAWEMPDHCRLGVVIPAQVNYVAKVFPAPIYGDRDIPALLILSKYLSNGYLYKTIRVQGGAYGGMSTYDPMNGVLAFLSYRDPRLAETLSAYDAAAALACDGAIDAADLETAIVGTIGALDRPTDPSGKGYTALIRHLARLSDAYRQALREGILDVSPGLMRDAAFRLLGPSADPRLAVFGSEEALRRGTTDEWTLEPLV